MYFPLRLQRILPLSYQLFRDYVNKVVILCMCECKIKCFVFSPYLLTALQLFRQYLQVDLGLVRGPLSLVRSIAELLE